MSNWTMSGMPWHFWNNSITSDLGISSTFVINKGEKYNIYHMEHYACEKRGTLEIYSNVKNSWNQFFT